MPEVPTEVNTSLKKQISHLLTVSPFDRKSLLKNSIFYLKYFDKTVTGAAVFSPEEEIEIAIESLEESDISLSQRLFCDRGVIQLIRKRVLAAFIFSLPPELVIGLEIDPDTTNYLHRLENAKEETLATNAERLLAHSHMTPGLRTLLNVYAHTFSTEEAFRQQGVILTRTETLNYDRAIQIFLDPKSNLVQGFKTHLRRYIFTRIANQTDSPRTIFEHLRQISELEISRKEKEYRHFNIIRSFRNNNPLKEITLLAKHIGLDGKAPLDLGDNYVMLAAFIYNLYLIDYRIPVGEKLYRMAMSTRPVTLLQELRKELHNSTKET